MRIEVARTCLALVRELVPLTLAPESCARSSYCISFDERVLERVGDYLVRIEASVLPVDFVHHLEVACLLQPGDGIELQQLAVEPVVSCCPRMECKDGQDQGSQR